MKNRTLQLFHIHMTTKKIHFADNGPLCDFYLTEGQIRDIIQAEYGIRPKRSRIVQKKLKQLVHSLLRELIDDAKETYDSI